MHTSPHVSYGHFKNTKRTNLGGVSGSGLAAGHSVEMVSAWQAGEVSQGGGL